MCMSAPFSKGASLCLFYEQTEIVNRKYYDSGLKNLKLHNFKPSN